MEFREQPVGKQNQPRSIAIARNRIQERIKAHPSLSQVEPPNLAYSIVYFTTVALLLALCVQAAIH